MNDTEGRRFEPIPAADLNRLVPREGRNEFMQPTYWNSGRAALLIGVLVVLGVVAYFVFI